MTTTIDIAAIRRRAADILMDRCREASSIRQAVFEAAGFADPYEATMREIRAESWSAPAMAYIDGLDIWAGIPIAPEFAYLVEPGFLVACLREPPTAFERIRAEASRRSLSNGSR
jgi:hypothetical protein